MSTRGTNSPGLPKSHHGQAITSSRLVRERMLLAMHELEAALSQAATQRESAWREFVSSSLRFWNRRCNNNPAICMATKACSPNCWSTPLVLNYASSNCANSTTICCAKLVRYGSSFPQTVAETRVMFPTCDNDCPGCSPHCATSSFRKRISSTRLFRWISERQTDFSGELLPRLIHAADSRN